MNMNMGKTAQIISGCIGFVTAAWLFVSDMKVYSVEIGHTFIFLGMLLYIAINVNGQKR